MIYAEKAVISTKGDKIDKLTKVVVDKEIENIGRMLSRCLESLISMYGEEIKSKGHAVQNKRGSNLGIYFFCGRRKELMIGLTLEGVDYILSVTSESEEFSKQLMNHIIYVSEFIPEPISYSQGEELETILGEIFERRYNN